MKTIFTCYRSEDEPYAATLLDHVLSPEFGSDVVFRASRSIDPGDDFEKKIFAAIEAASVLLVVIGPQWLDARDEHGRKLDNEQDMVRREILAAKKHGVRVIPVLVNTRRLRPADLPAELKWLAGRQDVRVDFRADYDLPALVAKLRRVIGPVAVTRSLLVAVAEHAEGGTRVAALVGDVLANAGVAADQVATEVRGDRLVAVLDVELLDVLENVLESLFAALSKARQVGQESWPRLLVTAHRGQVHRDGDTWSGAVLNEANDLLDLSEARKVLARADRAPCALVVSDSVYRELIVRGHGNLNPKAYAELAGSAGWIRVPGYPIPPVDAPAAEKPAHAGLVLSDGVNFHNLFHGNAIQHLDASSRRDDA
jgi:hypothetical protein